MSEETLDPATARRLGTSLAALLEAAGRQVRNENESELVARITGHLGSSLANAPNVTMSFGGWEHVNLQRGLDAYLAEHSPDAAWFGVAGGGRMHQDIMDMLAAAAQGATYQLGAVDYTTVATGPDTVTEAVQLGLVLTRAPDGAPSVITVRGPQPHQGPMPGCVLQVLAADRATATVVRDEVARLMRERDAFRGAILQFDINERRGNELVSFLPRPDLAADQVVLPEGVLDTLERHVVRGAEHNARLVALGQHLKRGLLL